VLGSGSFASDSASYKTDLLRETRSDVRARAYVPVHVHARFAMCMCAPVCMEYMRGGWVGRGLTFSSSQRALYSAATSGSFTRSPLFTCVSKPVLDQFVLDMRKHTRVVTKTR
jgi:hypothetical protein